MRKHYNPHEFINRSYNLQEVIKLLNVGHFNQFEPGLFDDVIGSMLSCDDAWVTLADFDSYVEAQEKAAGLYRNRDAWVQKSIINTARSGVFSTDRTMREYNDEIWKLTPISI